MNIIDTNLSRRSVLAGLGGMAFCIAIGNDGVRLMSQAQANTLANASVTPWVRIAPDGRITILSAGAEMGQGSMTSLPLIVAEELDADWSKVAIEWTPADAKIYGYKDPFGTEQLMWIVGSRAVQLNFTQLRTAGAQVRKVLIANAAQKWGVDPATLKTEPSVVVNPASGARLTYGEIAAFGTIPATLPAVDPKELKDRKDFRLIGKSVPRRDTPLKVNGTAQYAIDVKLPGMVYASTLHSPVHNAQAGIWDPGSRTSRPPRPKLERRRDQGHERRHRHRQVGQRPGRGRRSFRNGQGRSRRPEGDLEQGQGRRLQLRQGARGLRADPCRPERTGGEAGRERRRESGVCRRGQDLSRRVPQRLRLPRADGAAERCGPHQRWPATRPRCGRAARRPTKSRKAVAKALGLKDDAGRLPPVLHGRGLRPALARRLCGRVRDNRQAR